MHWSLKSADQGFARAQKYLGWVYHEGWLGFPQNYAEAAMWFRKAADRGEYASQLQLGEMYLEGRGVPQNYVSLTCGLI
jgi:TPR repeat protein